MDSMLQIAYFCARYAINYLKIETAQGSGYRGQP